MNTKRRKHYYQAIIAVCLCFLAVGIGFTAYMMKRNEEQNISYFKEASQNTGNTVENLISSNMETLDGVAITIGEMNVTDLQHLLPVLKEINNRNAFYRMGFIHTSGRGDMVDIDGTIHKDVDFTGEVFYQKALEGENSISEAVQDPYSDRYLNYYGVPVIINGETAGVLTAADNTDRIRMMLDTAIFSGGGFSNIISSSGEYIIRSLKSSGVIHIEEIGEFSSVDLDQIYRDLEAGEESFIEFEDNGTKSWASFRPLKINGWYLLGIVHKKDVNGAYYSIMGTIILISMAMMIFTFLIYFMSRMQRKSDVRLEKLAYEDSLLGIDNFVKFSMDIKGSLEQEPFRKVAYWYGDIDDFKLFNEAYGYEAGDRFLKNMSVLLGDTLEDGERYCRETADHFVGIRYYHTKQDLLDWYQKLTEKLEHYELSGYNSFRVVLSAGFYCAETPAELLTVNEMYNRAKMAQKSIKQKKDIKYAFYSDLIRETILRDNELEARMKEALSGGEFKVFIQPKTAVLKDNRIMGGEALVRWEIPGKGMISPGEFIPLFEKNGFIVSLDRFMFHSVCAWLRTYIDEGRRPIRVAVNVSRLGILQEDFLEYYTSVKEQYRIPDEMLELEFTESLAIGDNDLLGRRAYDLKQRGFICSLDDFGAGYSSLNTLKDLPIQVLKLDLLFFRKGTDEEKSRIIIENVIHLAKQLNIEIVAEGVEQPEQVEFLRKTGCDIIQGFVFGRPIPAGEFKKLLEEDPTGCWGDGFKETIKH